APRRAALRQARPGSRQQSRNLTRTAGLWPACRRDAGAPELIRSERRLLLGDQALDHAAHMHAVGVRGDIDKAPLAEFIEPPLLRFDHVLILDKGRRDLAIELLGRL